MKAKMALITEKPDQDNAEVEKKLEADIKKMPRHKRRTTILNMENMVN